MKRFFLAAMALVTVFALIACSAPAADAPAAATAAASEEPAAATTAAATDEPIADTNGDGEIRIACSVDGNFAFRHAWVALMEKEAAERGWVVDSTNADSDANKQIADTEALLSRDPDVFVMTAYSVDGAAPAVDAIYEAGVPCILYDFEVATDNWDTFLIMGNEQSGRLTGEYLNNWLAEDPNREANVGYLIGDYGVTTAMPRYTEMLAACPEANLVVEAQANWMANDAVKFTEDWLQAHPEINVYACQNDDMALGVIQALTAAGKIDDPEILIMGYDGIEAAYPYIEAGQMITVARNLPVEVQVILDTCQKLIDGETVDREIKDFADWMVVTADNLEEYKASRG